MSAENSTSPKSRPLRPTRQKRGFALIITITLLSFLVILLVSLASMTRVETQVATNTRELAQARQNALFGLQIALGQLQKYAGADQRITAPATTIFPSDDPANLKKIKDVTKGRGELYDGGTTLGAANGYRNFATTARGRSYLGNNASTYLTHAERASWNNALNSFWNPPSTNDPNSVGRSPHYLGVLDASLRVDRATNPGGPGTALPAQKYESNPATVFGEPKRDQIPIWLVSGVEKYIFDQQAGTVLDTAGNNQLAQYLSELSPTNRLPNPASTNDIVWMVNTTSATLANSSTSGLDGRVKVRKQTIKDAANTAIGHYAYWVGDESLKANFAVRDPYAGSLPGTVSYRNRLQVPQRLGWERITGFTNMSFDPNNPADPLYDSFSKIVSTSQIPLLDATLADNPSATRGPVPRSFHDLTGFSRSLLTDVALGGLKKDLTRYLKVGDGLNDSDPIANRTLYTNQAGNSDPRFRAWGATNTGFPVSTPPYQINSLSGGSAFPTIPTFGQLRAWYNNTSNGGGSIDATVDNAPVVTYIMFHGGWSYSNGTVRWHWLPCITLWNPYDVGLNSATYDLEVGISPVIWQGFIVKDRVTTNGVTTPTLAELQVDTEADWREVTIAPGAGWAHPNDPDLKLRNPDGTEYQNTGTSPARIWIFKGTTGVTGIPQPQYYAQIIPANGKPDSVDMTNGPWPSDDSPSGPLISPPTGLANGTTDAFGRFYYWSTNARPSDSVLSKDSNGTATNRSALGSKAFAIRYAPHSLTTSSAVLPVQRPLKFTITDSFGPGEAKVYTVGSTQSWSASGSVALTNTFDSTYPPSLYFDAFNINNGPASAVDENLRYCFSQLNSSVSAPTFHLKLAGATIARSDTPMGDITFNGILAGVQGNDYSNQTGFNTGGNANEDGDGTVNRDEAVPKFIKTWRTLYDFSQFQTKALTTAPANTDSSIWPYGATWIQPFTSDGGTTNTNVTDRLAVFSRFNLGAKMLDAHPLVDAKRARDPVNNTWGTSSATRLEGFTRLFYVENDMSAAGQKWDNDQYTGVSNPRGYALVAPKSLITSAGATILGQTSMPIRNARRATSEVLSLGQLQQVNLASYFWEPAFPIGNSWAPPYTDREAIAGLNSRFIGGVPTTLPGKVPAEVNNQTLDLSYLLNENLWDRYFLSSIPQTGALDTNAALPNSRHVFNAELNPTESTVRNFNNAAGYLYNVGALNVNSSSVEAWRALLSAFRGLALKATPTTPLNEATNVPVARTLDPIGGAIQFTSTVQDSSKTGATANNKDYSTVLSGFRYLTDAMIQTLAERIVDEVRLRGPFMSVSDFVNRRLVAPQGSNQVGADGTIAGGASAWYEARTNGYVGTEGSPATNGTPAAYPPYRSTDNHPDYIDPSYDPFVGLQGLSGALQRAIQVSGINGGVNHPNPTTTDRVYGIRIKNTGGTDFSGASHYSVIATLPTNANAMHSQDPAMRSYLDTEHIAGAPVGEAGQLFEGAPGFVTQGDLLAMIGPALTARGDTFIIRTYGDALNPATGETQGRAWLEAVVQRTIDPMVPASSTGSDRFRPTTQFGRKFKVVSFRWLNENDL